MTAILSDFDFKTEADKLILACRFLADVDLESIRHMVLHAHTLGPILDPTAYSGALNRGHLDLVGRLASRAQVVVSAFHEIEEKLANA